MKQSSTPLFILSLILSLVWYPAFAGGPEEGTETLDIYSSLSYQENMGQIIGTDNNSCPDVLFTAQSGPISIYLRTGGISMVFSEVRDASNSRVLHPNDMENVGVNIEDFETHYYRTDLDFIGANPSPVIVRESQMDGVVNCYVPHASNGFLNLKSYAQITYQNIYPNIDLVFYSANGAMKYDFIVHPGANPNAIRLKINGSDSHYLDAAGNLMIETPLGFVQENAPYCYQSTWGEIHSKYALNGGELSFVLNEYNPQEDLVIDPMRLWGSYYGGFGFDEADGGGIATDQNGNVVIQGYTFTQVFPVSPGAFQVSNEGGWDVYIAKIDKDGNRLWSTLIGGSSFDYGQGGIGFDLNGNIYAHGSTRSTNFPVTNGSEQSVHAGGTDDAYIVKFDPQGTLLWSTYFGGSGKEVGNGGMAVDNGGNVFIQGTTMSTDLPVSSNAFQPTKTGTQFDAYFAKFNTNGSKVWASYCGGNDMETGIGGVALDQIGNVYFHGHTRSQDFKTTPNAYQTSFGGGSSDAYVTKISSSGNPIWATYLGGSGADYGEGGIATDANGNVYVHGTTSSTNFPVSSGAPQTSLKGSNDAYIVKFSTTGNHVWGSYIGGSSQDKGQGGIAVDSKNNIAVQGYTYSSDFPITVNAFQTNYGGGIDATVCMFNENGNRIWSSFIGGTSEDLGEGGVAFDHSDNMLLYGGTASTNFPVGPGAAQQEYSGGFPYDAYILKFSGMEVCNLSINPGVMKAPSCFGDSDGFLQLVESGNTGPVEYSLDNGMTFQTSSAFSGLAAGNYLAIAKDASGCTSSVASVNVNNPPQIMVGASLENISCQGMANGEIEVAPSGGAGGFSCSIDGGTSFQSATQFDKLNSGAYSIVVRDKDGCLSLPVTTNLHEPTSLNISVNSNSASCSGGNATVVLKASGGVAPFEYSIDGGLTFQVTNSFSGLNAGVFSCSIQDDNGCQNSSQVMVTPGGSATATISCCGDTFKTCTETIFIPVDMTGPSPWTLVYSNGVSMDTVVTSVTPYMIEANNNVTTTYSVVSVECIGGCVGAVCGQATVGVNPNNSAKKSSKSKGSKATNASNDNAECSGKYKCKGIELTAYLQGVIEIGSCKEISIQVQSKGKVKSSEADKLFLDISIPCGSVNSMENSKNLSMEVISNDSVSGLTGIRITGFKTKKAKKTKSSKGSKGTKSSKSGSTSSEDLMISYEVCNGIGDCGPASCSPMMAFGTGDCIQYTIVIDGSMPAASKTGGVDPTAPIDPNMADFNANVYPNPTTGMVTLDWACGSCPTEGHSHGKYRVINSIGAVMFEGDLFVFKGKGASSIDLSDLVPGVYFLETKVKEQRKVLRIIKQ